MCLHKVTDRLLICVGMALCVSLCLLEKGELYSSSTIVLHREDRDRQRERERDGTGEDKQHYYTVTDKCVVSKCL